MGRDRPVMTSHSATGFTPVPMRRVLVVDDHRDVADTLCDVMLQLGYEARTAYDGATALATASDFDADIVVLDLRLPDIDGHEVCRRLRAQRGGTRIQVIAL